jgi:hypothetical protein
MRVSPLAALAQRILRTVAFIGTPSSERLQSQGVPSPEELAYAEAVRSIEQQSRS